MNPADIIQVVGLSKSFNGLPALDNVSFAVRRGEIFGYLGANGAGKTTTIKILCGLLGRDSGEIDIAGADIAKDPVTVKQCLGVVPDESNLYPELTCQRNLEYLGELYGLTRAVRQKRRAELLAAFSLTEKAATPFGALSRGLKRRLTIAAALIHAPEILFLDEPTTGLDVPSAKSLRALLQQINQQDGVTVFLTTHNLYEAEALCHRIQIIHKGRTVVTGTAPEIRQRVERVKTLEVTLDRPVSQEWWGSDLPGGKPPVQLQDRWRLELAGQDLHQVLKLLLSRTEAEGLHIMDLRTGGASLEDAFVAILQGQADGMSQEA